MVDKIDFLRFYIRISRTFLRDAFRYQFKFYENFMRHDHAFTKKMPYWILLKSLLVMPIPYHNRMWHTVCRILYRNSKKNRKIQKKTEKIKVLHASSKQAILKAEYLKSQIYTVGPFLSCTYFPWNYFFLSCLIVIDLQQLQPKI